MTPESESFATLVICSFDRRDSLDETLDSVADQRSAAPWDVLVVDNNSSDGTAEAVAQRAAGFPVPLRVIREERQGRSHALNRAIDATSSEVLIFTDDDVDLRPGFVAAHCAAYEDAAVAGAGGRILPVMPDNTPPWMRALAEEANGGLTGRYDWGDEVCRVEVDGDIHLPYGANMSLRRRVAREFGGFRPDLGWGKSFVPGEENELFGRVRSGGGSVVYRPDAVALHRFQPDKATLEYFLRYELGYGRAQVLIAELGRRERLRWVLRNALGLAVHSARAGLPTRKLALRIEPLRQRARSLGRLAQLLGC